MSNGASVRQKDPLGARETFDTGSGSAYLYRLDRLEALGYSIDHLPFSIRILLEALLRGCDRQKSSALYQLSYSPDDF